MSTVTAILLALQLSIFLTVLTIGMQTTTADLRYVLGNPARLARALLAINVLGPVVAIPVCKLFSLHPAVAVGLVTLAVAPVSNLMPKSVLPLVGSERRAYVHGLFFASTMLSVVLTPLAVKAIDLVFHGSHDVSPLAVAKVVAGGVLLPLAIGLAIGRRWPGAMRWIPAIQKSSGIVLLVCALVIVAAVWSQMTSLVREGTVTAIVVIALAGVAAGHFLGGPDEDERTVLAQATVSRHPGVAMVVASLADQPLAPVGVLLAVLVSSIAVMPYTRWRKRRYAAAPASGSGSSAAGPPGATP